MEFGVRGVSKCVGNVESDFQWPGNYKLCQIGADLAVPVVGVL